MRHEELVKEIVIATNGVFDTMLGQSVVVVKDSVEHGGTGRADGVAALVGVAGEWQGNGCVSCTGELACKLAAQMLQAHYDTVNDDVLDAMGEIANMVIGNIKTNLESVLGPMGLSIPTVVYGRNFATRAMGKLEWTVVTFDCGGELLLVQMMLTKSVAGPPLPRSSYSVLTGG